MILIDLSQTLFSVLFQNQKNGLSKDLARGMIFMTLLSYKKQFSQRFGAPVLAIDSRDGYWRRDIFEGYKANRKRDRESNDKVDWEMFFDIAQTVTAELQEVLPWKTVYVPKAEADDIIAVLATQFGDKPTLILSSDKDYKQLHTKEGIAQYSPIMKKWINTDNPKRDLQELILTGDASDGIPNVRSDVDSIMTGKRQLPITKKLKEEFLDNPAKVYRDHKERYDLNEKLIDFSFIPDDIRSAILEAYAQKPNGNIQKLYQFFIAKRMSRMMEDINLFKVKEGEYEAIGSALDQYL